MALIVYPANFDSAIVDSNEGNQTAPGIGSVSLNDINDDGYGTNDVPPSDEHNFIFNRHHNAIESNREIVFKDWVTATPYEEFERVMDSLTDKIYKANVAHTSGATFAADIAKWDEVSKTIPNTSIDKTTNPLINTGSFIQKRFGLDLTSDLNNAEFFFDRWKNVSEDLDLIRHGKVSGVTGRKGVDNFNGTAQRFGVMQWAEHDTTRNSWNKQISAYGELSRASGANPVRLEVYLLEWTLAANSMPINIFSSFPGTTGVPTFIAGVTATLIEDVGDITTPNTNPAIVNEGAVKTLGTPFNIGILIIADRDAAAGDHWEYHDFSLVVGDTAIRAPKAQEEELVACNRFYNSSYDITVAAGSGLGGSLLGGPIVQNTQDGTNAGTTFDSVKFPIDMVKVPAVSHFDVDGNISQVSFGNTTGNGRTIAGGSAAIGISQSGFRSEYSLSAPFPTQPNRHFNYTANAEL